MKTALALLLLGTACESVVAHRPTNAPGIVRVDAPPADLSRRGLEEPEDPGERFLVVSGGALLGGSARFDAPGEDAASAHVLLGVEGSLLLGESPFSHDADAMFVYPQAGWGVNLDLGIVDDDWGVGPLALELARAQMPWAIAAGPVWDVQEGGFGAQATASVLGLYLRVTALDERGVDVELGLAFKLPAMLVWSR